MKILLFLALAYIAPILLLLVFAQGWTWLYVFPIVLTIAGTLTNVLQIGEHFHSR